MENGAKRNTHGRRKEPVAIAAVAPTTQAPEDQEPQSEAGDTGNASGHHRGASADEADYVGYGHPPKRHRFKAGQSGNPRGRPRGARGTNTILREVLSERIEITDKGKRRKLSLRELIHRRLAEKAAKGDLKAIAQVMIYDERLYGFDEEPQQSAQLSPDEQAIIDDARARRERAKSLRNESACGDEPPRAEGEPPADEEKGREHA